LHINKSIGDTVATFAFNLPTGYSLPIGDNNELISYTSDQGTGVATIDSTDAATHITSIVFGISTTEYTDLILGYQWITADGF
jgi:hypothetical protein